MLLFIFGNPGLKVVITALFSLSSKQISENCLSNLGVKRMLPSPSLLALQGILGLGK